MDLVRRHVGRGVVRQPLGIIARTILETPDTVVGSGDFFLRRHFGYQRLIRGLHRGIQRVRRVSNQQVFFDLADVELGHLCLKIGI